jgi:hypothetical protein
MEKRLRGRPRLDPTDRTVSVSIRFPGRQLERLYRDAELAAVTVPELLRRRIKNSKIDKRE